MPDRAFIAYIGGRDFHDAYVRAVSHIGDHVEVTLEAHNERKIQVHFSGVRKVMAVQPEGMMIYALSEMQGEAPYRYFIFTNWEEDDQATLEVEALELSFQ